MTRIPAGFRELQKMGDSVPLAWAQREPYLKQRAGPEPDGCCDDG
jgi:hypothetical protein